MWERSRLGREGARPEDFETSMLLADHDATGEPVFEEVAVERVGADALRLLATPGVTEDVAAGDVVRLDGELRPQIVERGGNLAVKLFLEDVPRAAVERLLDRVEAIGGWLDGFVGGRLVVLTFPVASGFPRVEALLNGFVAEHGGGWYYGNVHDEHDRPLDWWR